MWCIWRSGLIITWSEKFASEEGREAALTHQSQHDSLSHFDLFHLPQLVLFFNFSNLVFSLFLIIVCWTLIVELFQCFFIFTYHEFFSVVMTYMMFRVGNRSLDHAAHWTYTLAPQHIKLSNKHLHKCFCKLHFYSNFLLVSSKFPCQKWSFSFLLYLLFFFHT